MAPMFRSRPIPSHVRAVTAGRGPRKDLGDRLREAIGQSDFSPCELAEASGANHSSPEPITTVPGASELKRI